MRHLAIEAKQHNHKAGSRCVSDCAPRYAGMVRLGFQFRLQFSFAALVPQR
jgi:hypothetical protein